MAGGKASKNSRMSTSTQKFFCPCGGEIEMITIIDSGRKKTFAQCKSCKKTERRPSDFN